MVIHIKRILVLLSIVWLVAYTGISFSQQAAPSYVSVDRNSAITFHLRNPPSQASLVLGYIEVPSTTIYCFLQEAQRVSGSCDRAFTPVENMQFYVEWRDAVGTIIRTDGPLEVQTFQYISMLPLIFH